MPFDYYTNEDIGEYVNFQGVNEFWLGKSWHLENIMFNIYLRHTANYSALWMHIHKWGTIYQTPHLKVCIFFFFFKHV